MTPPRLSLRKYAPPGLVALWLAAQLLALHQGPRVVYDSHRYLGYAQQLVDGWGIGSTHNVRYLGYAAYLSAFLRAGLGLWPIILGQTLLSGLATVAYYRAFRYLTPADWRPAVLATALTIAWPDLQRFNAYLLTESLFASAVMVSFWAVARLRQPRHVLLALPVFLAATLLRPNGFLVPAAAAATLLYGVWHRSARPGRIGLALLTATLFGAAIPLLNRWLTTYHLIQTYAR
ncbi:MAG TPA: hypothetical protein VEI97_20375, partial [bacterium]|nr:hypothetical protein [bacterium]